MEIQTDYRATVVSTKDWVITYLITAIPLVGFIMLFVWAFGSDTNHNKANWAKAALIWMVIAMALSILIFLVFGAAIFGAMAQSNAY